MNVMASSTRNTCIRNDGGTIKNVIGQVVNNGGGANVNIGLLLI